MQLKKILLIVLLGGYTSVAAQDILLKELAIGDEVPDLPFRFGVNFAEKSPKLSDFRGKLVILDFWATYCSPCIGAFPKMEKLQQQFGDRIRIILVNSRQDMKAIAKGLKVYEKNQPHLRLSALPGVNGDTAWAKLFPHRSIPHHVWISEEGKVLAMTAGHNATAEKISTYLQTGKLNVALKKELDIDRSKPLFLDERLDVKNLRQYSILIKGTNGISAAGQNLFAYNEYTSGVAIHKSTIDFLYRSAVLKFWPEVLYKRMLIEVEDPSAFKWEANDEWLNEHTYSFNMIVPKSEEKNLGRYMLEDLNRYSKYWGRIEKRHVKYIALVRTSGSDKLHTKGGSPEQTLLRGKKKAMINYDIGFLVKWLNSISILDPLPVIDETGYADKADIELPGPYTDIEALRIQLQKYDLDLVEKNGEIDMFVLGDKK